MHVMELAFKADFAIVKAWKGDTAGNLILKELQTLIRACQVHDHRCWWEELVEEACSLIKFIFLEYSCNIKAMKKIEQRTVRIR
jgi:3-oxoacid CoA-transferase subunit A